MRSLFPLRSSQKSSQSQKEKERRVGFRIEKRQKFVASVLFLSFILFLSEFFFPSFGIVVAFMIGVLADVLFFFSMYQKGVEKPHKQAYILPFLYSLAFGLFYLLAPSRILTRILMTSIYAIGLYSLYLSENIFSVASIRTIALLNGARIISFVITLVSYFFIMNTIFSLRIHVIPTGLIMFAVSFLFTLFSIWTYTLEKPFFQNWKWVIIISSCLLQLGVLLWFWPTSPTVVSLYLTSIFYILLGLTHIWFDKRLFKGVLWEYIWLTVFTFVLLLVFTTWQ